MYRPKYIGTVPFEDVEKTFDPAEAWKPLNFEEIPYRVISPPSTYMLTLGSGNYSAPTTSVYQQKYISGIDLLRRDVENGQIVVDVDHYIASPMRDSFAIFKEPPGDWHRLRPDDERLNYIDKDWQRHIRDILEGNTQNF